MLLRSTDSEHPADREIIFEEFQSYVITIPQSHDNTALCVASRGKNRVCHRTKLLDRTTSVFHDTKENMSLLLPMKAEIIRAPIDPQNWPAAVLGL